MAHHLTSRSDFLPTSAAEMKQRGWDAIDVLLITGDAYIDHPSFGIAVIARVLEAEGLRVGLIAQPDWTRDDALLEMGRPRLFCGITAGNLDSMVSNYTAARRKRIEDSYSEGGESGLRPNMATVVYSQMARKAFSGIPVVLGGIEASLRRVVHYDYWQDKLRPSILQDSKADILVFGMGEGAILEIARRLEAGNPLDRIPGTARLLKGKESAALDEEDFHRLPTWDECKAEKKQLLLLTRELEREQNPFSGRRLLQWHGSRALILEPPAEPITTDELDRIHELPYTRLPHKRYKKPIPAFQTIKDSLIALRGCAGGCSFCGLGLHQGRFLSSRSQASVNRELAEIAGSDSFRGTVSDVGGPTANLYGCENGHSESCKKCRRSSCLFPTICKEFKVTIKPLLNLMDGARQISGIKHVFIQSGVRMDVALKQPGYIDALVKNHVSGHLKVAPEHLHADTLKRMRKPAGAGFEEFRSEFERAVKKADKRYYLVPYFISNFPGSTADDMSIVERYLKDNHWQLQQVQDYIPLPMTPGSAMYYAGLDYSNLKPIQVNRGLAERREQMRQLKSPQRKASKHIHSNSGYRPKKRRK